MADEKNHKQPQEVQRAPITVGRVVHYFKETEDKKGVKKLMPFSLHVADVEPPGSFQLKDQAIGGWILQPPRKGGLEYRDGVLFSETPAHGRWSYPKIV